MNNFDANACMGAFCKLCEAAVVSELITAEEYQYWVFEQGYLSANASIASFSKLCDEADNSDLLSAIDCQYWLFEHGYLAAKLALTNTVEMVKVKSLLQQDQVPW